MKSLFKNTKRTLFLTTYILLLLFFLCSVGRYAISVVPFGITSDVAKRIKSPDGRKTALLIRRIAFDLNFIVKIKGKGANKILHSSRDFIPNDTADWNEKIIWSDDSSLIVLMVDDVWNNNEKYMWAYDFKNEKEYFDIDEITGILKSRNVDWDKLGDEIRDKFRALLNSTNKQ